MAWPSSRSHHAMAEMGGELLLFGGEARMRGDELDELLASRKHQDLPNLPPLQTRSEATLK